MQDILAQSLHLVRRPQSDIQYPYRHHEKGVWDTQQNNTASFQELTNYSTRFDYDRKVLVQRNADMEYKQWSKTFSHSLGLSRFFRPTNPSPRRACIWKNYAKTTLCFRGGHNMRYLDRAR